MTSKKKALYLLVILSVITIGLILWVLIYSGLFADIIIKEKKAGPYQLVYLSHKGDYRQTGQIGGEIYYDLLSNYQIETTKGFGIYYDDPDKVKKEDLRSDIGVILNKEDYKKTGKLKKKYKTKRIYISHCLVVEFPFKSKISIILGIYKVYPKIKEYVKIKEYKSDYVMEVYDIPAKKILYIMPIKK